MKRIALILFSVFFVTSASAQGNYTVQPGDSLSIEVLEDSSLNRSVLVLPDGRITFPFAGSVQAAGLTVSQIQRAITAKISSNFAAPPNVYVNVNSVFQGTTFGPAKTIKVYMIGEVNQPGAYDIDPGTTLLQFLAESGGFSKFAATKRIQLRRRDARTGREIMFKINYKAIARGAQLENDAPLVPGDVIIVPERRLFE